MRYTIVDFKGLVYWVKLNDGSYAVDPEHVDKFKELFLIK